MKTKTVCDKLVKKPCVYASHGKDSSGGIVLRRLDALYVLWSRLVW